jgi:hypothetical protein
MQVQCDGVAGMPLRIEAAANLPPAWSTVLETNPLSLPVTWTDPATPAPPQRFYRAVHFP